MAVSSKIKIMISSRCNDRFPLETKSAKTLSAIRAELKNSIEGISRCSTEMPVGQISREPSAFATPSSKKLIRPLLERSLS